MEKEKLVLDWKVPSERKMADFVGKLEDEMKKEFAETCVVMKDGKATINKSKARNWLVEKFDETEDIQWNGRPKKREKSLSGAETIAQWLNL